MCDKKSSPSCGCRRRTAPTPDPDVELLGALTTLRDALPDLADPDSLANTLNRVTVELAARRRGSEKLGKFIRDELGLDWPDDPQERFVTLMALLSAMRDSVGSDEENIGLHHRLDCVVADLNAANKLKSVLEQANQRQARTIAHFQGVLERVQIELAREV